MHVIAAIMLIVYSATIMSMLLDVRFSQLPAKKRTIALIYALGILILNAVVSWSLGQERYGLFYPFLVQAPIYIGFLIVSRYKGIKLFFVLLSIMVFAAPPLMCVTALRTFYQIGMPASLAVFFICYVLTGLFVYKFLKVDFNYMLKYCESRKFWLFCLIPMLHYIYSYARTSYNFIQPFSQNGYFVKQIPFLIVLASYILLVRVFKNARETQVLQSEAGMMQMQLETAQFRMDELKTAQEQTVIYRHDIRHHLSLLGSFATEGNIEKIKVYLTEAQKNIQEITPIKFSENETVNLILSSFAVKARQIGVELAVKTIIPTTLPMPDSELCALLSNLLENAVTAVSKVTDGREKKVRLNLEIFDEKLLIEMRNPYVGEILFENGLPINEREGHGFGGKSIAAIVSKHHGMYSFKAESGEFVVRIVL